MTKQNAANRANIRRTIWSALTLNSQLYEAAKSNQVTQRTAFRVVTLKALSRAFGSKLSRS